MREVVYTSESYTDEEALHNGMLTKAENSL